LGKTYESYLQLRSAEREGLDYSVRFRRGSSGIAVMAPHGGDIEPGTTEIAEAAAGRLHSFYTFEGLRPDHNLDLHIASTLFDEPEGLKIASEAAVVVTIHGCRERDPVVFTGGLDLELRRAVKRGLESEGFPVQEDPRLPGMSLMNLCNRSSLGRGLQLEVSRGLRWTMFGGLRRAERREHRRPFELFVGALRTALDNYAGKARRM
jgi:phage replication-related protein YjqB (UPF0714/DUF867 family)